LGQGESGDADERIRYTLPKPRPDGSTSLTLAPLELLDGLAALIAPPRRHRHRYHGVFAPHSPLRAAVTAYAGKSVPGGARAGAAGRRLRLGAPAGAHLRGAAAPLPALRQRDAVDRIHHHA
jgi:hypothetical protein